MDNNIFPDHIARTRDSNGTSYNTSIFSMEAWANLSFVMIIFYLILGTIILPVLSGVFLAIYMSKVNPHSSWLNIFGILAGTYVILDLKYDWFFSILLPFFYEPESIRSLTFINGGMVATHMFLLFFGPLMYKVTNNRLIIFLWVSILFFIAYFVVKNLFEKNILPVF